MDTLKGKGPFTVFAPTDEAFAKVPKEKLEALLKDRKALTAVLTYHVVPAKVTAADVVKLDSAKTVQGGSLKIVTRRARSRSTASTWSRPTSFARTASSTSSTRCSCLPNGLRRPRSGSSKPWTASTGNPHPCGSPCSGRLRPTWWS